MSVDRARILSAQYHGCLTNRVQIRVDRDCLLECQQRGADVARAQADLTEAAERAKMARFELEGAPDVVETIGVALFDESPGVASF